MHPNIVIIACEGKTERRVSNDLIDRDKLSLKITGIEGEYEISTEVVHPGIIDTWFNTNKDKYDVILFLIDKDVEVETQRALSVEIQAKRLGLKFIPLFQNPHIETFFACCFEEFSIDESLTVKELKKAAEKFLMERMNLTHTDRLKRITINKIQNKGGNTKNALRYKDRFDILEILK